MGLCLLYNLFCKRDTAADIKQGRCKRAAGNVVSYVHLPYVFFCYFPSISHFFSSSPCRSQQSKLTYQGTGANSKLRDALCIFTLDWIICLHLCPLHGEYVFCVLQKMQTSCRPARWLAVMLLLVFTPGQCQQKDRWGRPYKLRLTLIHVNDNLFFFLKCNWMWRFMHKHRC